MTVSPFRLSLDGKETGLKVGDAIRITLPDGLISFSRPMRRGPVRRLTVGGHAEEATLGIPINGQAARSVAWLMAASVGCSIQEKEGSTRTILYFELVSP